MLNRGLLYRDRIADRLIIVIIINIKRLIYIVLFFSIYYFNFDLSKCFQKIGDIKVCIFKISDNIILVIKIVWQYLLNS